MLRGVPVVVVSLLVMLGVVVSSAFAAPQGIFSIYAQCPTGTPGVTLCVFGQTTSGELSIGSTEVPIDKTITVQGGAIPTGNPEDPREYFLVPAQNGESLSKTELNVPGGLLNKGDCGEIRGRGFLERIARGACRAIARSRATWLTATTELLASEKDPAVFDFGALARETGAALTLPVRIHLKNPFLGKACYIGSPTNPIQLHLTTGASGNAHGKLGEVETLEEQEQLQLRVFDNSLVDNSFAAPGAEGCGDLGFIKGYLDSIIDAKLKIPNNPGANTVVLNGELKAATPEAILASETF
jgi:hypothetical protein